MRRERQLEEILENLLMKAQQADCDCVARVDESGDVYIQDVLPGTRVLEIPPLEFDAIKCALRGG